MNMSHGKCHACGDNGYFVECKDVKSDTEPVKVVHEEVIGLITTSEDPELSKVRRRGWYLASRCTVHVCNSRDMFVDYHPWTGHEVVLDNNEHVNVEGIGSVVLRFTTGKILTLSNVFHIPAIRKCLMSVGKLTDTGFKILLWSGGAIVEKNNEVVGRGYIEDGLFRLSITKFDNEPAKVVHNEVIGLITDEDPVLSKMRRRGWYLASRCTVHVCNSRDMFVDYHPWSGHEVILDNDEHADVAGIGSVVLRFTTGKVLTLSNVFHIPAIRKCLVSVGKLTGIGFKVTLWSGGATIEKNHEIVGKGFIEGGLFRLSIIKPDTEPTKAVQNEVIGLANDDHADVTGIGTVVLPLSTGNVLTLPNVIHTPAINKNLLIMSVFSS
ncbi:putative RNA-directed DNA polymerase [Helianthus annuus]|nr:putative RNA-directed DNA polymerase [Helianthus annuus]KAJ0675270.1 putative RNA-directed DNA polymerase [Helianthus annuus]